MYTYKIERDHETAPRVLLALKFGRHDHSGSRAIAVAAINFRPGTLVKDNAWATTEGIENIFDWTVYIGSTVDPEDLVVKNEDGIAISLTYVALHGSKTSKEVGIALFPQLPGEKWRF